MKTMRRSIWFKALYLGGVPVRWVPVKWQGWAVIAAYVGAFTWAMTLRNTPARMIAVEIALIAVLLYTVMYTDDRAR